MCLYNQGSHGLDLSFVTHIFLLEPIRDAGLLEQIISRAHRIGVKQEVRVVTLHVWQTQDHVDPPHICDHCYETFESEVIADEHIDSCSRNPQNKDQIPHFTLRKLFLETQPPVVVEQKQVPL